MIIPWVVAMCWGLGACTGPPPSTAAGINPPMRKHPGPRHNFQQPPGVAKRELAVESPHPHRPVASHHGAPEGRRFPSPEAVALHAANSLDARVNDAL